MCLSCCILICHVVLQALCSWLSNSPNYEEITKWYLGWKSMFSDQVLAHPSIKDKFNEALDIMNRAVSSSVGRWLVVVAAQQCWAGVSLCGGMALLLCGSSREQGNSRCGLPCCVRKQRL